MYGCNAAVTPRNGHTLVFGVVARFSSCQAGVNLQDQVDHAQEVATDLYQGDVEYHVVATPACGDRLARPGLAEIEALLYTQTLDLLVVEDISRLARGPGAFRLFGIAVDCGTRVLAPNDGIDTADANWEMSLVACANDVGHHDTQE